MRCIFLKTQKQGQLSFELPIKWNEIIIFIINFFFSFKTSLPNPKPTLEWPPFAIYLMGNDC